MSNISNSINTAPHMNNAALRFRSDSPYQQRTTQRDNPTQLVIKQAVDYLIKQLEAGKSETLAAYLTAMAKFRKYSFANVLSIVRACPQATHVAGIRTWNELGRFVKKGEKGIPILAPVICYRRKKQNEAEENESEQRKAVLAGFRIVHVFDYGQTTGADLPQPASVFGEVGDYLDRLMEFVKRQGIELEYNERIAPALGVSYGGKIALLPGQSKAETLTTLVHELGHEILHTIERRTTTTATVRETEAEAVAFVVGQAVGLEMGTAASDYILTYAGNAALLTESLEVIQRTSAVILAAIRPEETAQTEQLAAVS
ncbi:MAG: ArdC family protein [Terracidiphilus sp.]